MSGKNFFLYSLLLSFLINFFLYFIFENKSAIGQGAYCQPLPYLTFSGSWPGQGYLVMTSSTPNVLVRYEGGGAGIVSGSGSPGQIAFWSGSSILSGDNNLFWDNTNKRLGIGTTTPQTTLHVIGDITATNFIGNYAGTVSSAKVSSGVFGSLTGGGNFSFPAFLGISTSSQLNLPQPLSVYGNAYIEGNLGIGTTTPTAKLHVAGGSAVVGYIAGSSGGVFITEPAAYGQPAIQGVTPTFSPGTLAINPVGGNVGIGTTNPGAKLHVKGAAYFEGTDPTAPGIFAKLVEYGGGGRLYLGKSNLYGGDEVFMEGFGNIMFFASNRPGALLVWINDGSLTVDRSLTVKSNVYLASVSGNVGIGTGSPSYKLEINGTLGYTGGTGPFCIFANACPNGWVDKGLGGYIYNSGGGATCPYSVGAAFNASWTWCHPRICCQW